MAKKSKRKEQDAIKKCASFFTNKTNKENEKKLCAQTIPMINIHEERPFHSAIIYERQTGDKLTSNTMGILSFGRCNFTCIYCKRGGMFKDDKLRIRNSKEILFADVVNRSAAIAEQGKIVRFSGGEPILFKPYIDIMSKRLKQKYPHTKLSIASNMSCSSILGTTDYIDIYASDIKGTPRNIKEITGVSKKLGLDAPLANIEKLDDLGAKFIEIRTPIFSSTQFKDLEMIYRALPKKSKFSWTLRPYSKVKGIEGIEPPTSKQIDALKRKLFTKYPALQDKIIIRKKGF